MNLERKFSKELVPDLRKETADKLREARKKPETFSDFRKSGISVEDYKFSEFSDTKERLETLKKNIFGRIFRTDKFREEEVLLNEFLKIEKKIDIRSVKEDYEIKFEEILKNSPLTESEKDMYLSTESMEKMSLKDFLTLSKRLSGEAFYHVTRYGVRENTFMSTGGGHGKGLGTFLDDFTPILKGGSIKDCTTTILLPGSSRVNTFVKDQFVKEQKEAGKTVDEITNEILTDYPNEYFLDRESTHVSYGRDLHHMYGGENNYKFYFYYPVEYILHNDFYNRTRETAITIGDGYARNRMGIEQQYNDFEIFNFGKGIPVNAGILCITEGVEVDPETGSQYMLVDGKPVLDENGNFKKPEKTIDSKEYWEKYFILHPELKPSKVIYKRGMFSTYNNRAHTNPGLKDWAKSKLIYEQDEVKQKEFKDYKDRMKEALRIRIYEAVVTKFNN